MITTAEPGERVRYTGKEGSQGLRGTVVALSESPCKEGCPRYRVEFDHGALLDMCVTVLTNDEPKEAEMGKGRTTTVTHPDGTTSTRTSASMVYAFAVERREDLWETAKTQRKVAADKRAEKARFITAVRAGRIAVRGGKFFEGVYLLGEGGEEWWLGAHTEAEPLDRKAAVRTWLPDCDALAAAYEDHAAKAESGPQYQYGVMRWSQSHENALKGLQEFQRANYSTSTFRVVPAESA